MMQILAVATLLLQFLVRTVLSGNIALPNCQATCGRIDVPYPFGIGPGCSSLGFNLTCNQTYQPPKLFFGDGTIEVIEISLLKRIMVFRSNVITTSVVTGHDVAWAGVFDMGTFALSTARNRFTVMGCSIQAILHITGEPGEIMSICASMCATDQQNMFTDNACSGVGCCQTSIPASVPSFGIRLDWLNQTSGTFLGPGEGAGPFTVNMFVVEQEWFNENAAFMKQRFGPVPSSSHPSPVVIPAVLDWMFGGGSCEEAANNASDLNCRSDNSFCRTVTSNMGGHQCLCSTGYEGNPYISDGCLDIDECAHPDQYPCFGNCINLPGTYACRCPPGTSGNATIKDGCVTIKKFTGLIIGLGVGSGVGLLFLVLAAIFITRKLKVQRAKKLRAKFFKQNRGLLLQQLVDKDIAERMMFTLEELEKATNKFDEARKLGGGGHGTVYKGILSDQHVVAIKKSKVVIQREIDEFINEVAILSQINHRNVVKMFGCCLETQVPLLVYEFISNGTLYDHLHVEGPESLSWEDRLRIALETARALAYLHSAASTSIIHRDIKSANILLDDRLTAKVSDFGASRGIAMDQTGVTTVIQGTFGYLDPEYFHTSRLTEKSDVYSFGVVLVELLTRKKPSSVHESPEGVALVAHFILLMRRDKLFDILDPQVAEEGGREATEVAAIAALCLSLQGEERPTMRQVEMRLEGLLGSRNNLPRSLTAQRYEESQIVQNYPSMEGGNDNTSRQYSMEEEILLSAKYPR